MYALIERNRKIALSLAVVAGAVFLFSIGIWIENKILDGAERKAQMYQTAIQTQNDREFNYSIDTQQGKILADVTIKQEDTVKFPEMDKEFPRVHKTEERYTQHEREVCETEYRTETHTEQVPDGEGGYTTETVTEEVPYEECHQETYYSWDQINEWTLEAKEVNMAGRKYPLSLFSLGSHNIDAKDIIPGEKGEYVIKKAEHWLDIDIFGEADEGDIRYGYEVLQLPQSGTVFLDTIGGLKPVFGGRIGLSGVSPKQQVTDAQNAAHTQSMIFNIFWWILILAELGFGMYAVWFYEDYN